MLGDGGCHGDGTQHTAVQLGHRWSGWTGDGPGCHCHGDTLGAWGESLWHPQGGRAGRAVEANGVLAVCIKRSRARAVLPGSWLLSWPHRGDISHHPAGGPRRDSPRAPRRLGAPDLPQHGLKSWGSPPRCGVSWGWLGTPHWAPQGMDIALVHPSCVPTTSDMCVETPPPRDSFSGCEPSWHKNVPRTWMHPNVTTGPCQDQGDNRDHLAPS